eukprot:363769-Chlamydomonas_euryale.AAC.6
MQVYGGGDKLGRPLVGVLLQAAAAAAAGLPPVEVATCQGPREPRGQASAAEHVDASAAEHVNASAAGHVIASAAEHGMAGAAAAHGVAVAAAGFGASGFGQVPVARRNPASNPCMPRRSCYCKLPSAAANRSVTRCEGACSWKRERRRADRGQLVTAASALAAQLEARAAAQIRDEMVPHIRKQAQ